MAVEKTNAITDHIQHYVKIINHLMSGHRNGMFS